MRLFSGRTVLGVEVTPSQIKVVETDPSSSPPRILNFAALELLSPHPDNISRQLSTALKSLKVSTRSAAVTLPGPDIRYRVTDFPPLPADELKVVVEREVRRGRSPVKEDQLVSWERLDEAEIEGRRRQRVLVVTAPLPQISEHRDLLEKAGLTVTSISTIPLALLNSLRLTRGWEEKKVCLVHIGAERGYILFARSGLWSFHREFSLRGRREEEGLWERVLVEANVAVLYDREHSPGESIAQMIVSGEGDLSAVQKALQERHDIPTTLFQLEAGVDFLPVGPKAAEFSKAAANFIVPLGLAGRPLREGTINLLPREVVEKRAAVRRRAVALAAAAVVLFLLGGLFLSLSRSAANYRAVVQTKRTEEARLSAFLRMVEETKQEAERQRRLSQLITGRMPRRGTWAEVFQDLSLAVSEEVLLHSLELRKEKRRWNMTLKGEATGQDVFSTQRAFHTFFQTLRGSPRFKKIELMPFTLAPVAGGTKEAGPSTPLRTGLVSAEEDKRSKVGFEIHIRLEE